MVAHQGLILLEGSNTILCNIGEGYSFPGLGSVIKGSALQFI